MPDAVFKDVHTKVVCLAYTKGSTAGANMVSGTLFISGSKLWFIGASGAEVVTSS